MTIYLVDLMPVLWSIAMTLSLWLATGGELFFLARFTAPALVGFIAYLLSYPARLQLFAAIAACITAELAKVTVCFLKEQKKHEGAVTGAERI